LKTIVLLSLLLFLPVCIQAQVLVKETRQRVSLTDGNELYSWCEAAENVVVLSGGTDVMMRSSATQDEVVMATKCWTYIEAVVDSTPAGDEFDPSPGVRLSQYVDVVTAFLKSHPSTRDKNAAPLVMQALIEGFPHRKS
jgi:hypothetical protein